MPTTYTPEDWHARDPETGELLPDERCAGCGKLDDHPMLHTDLPSWTDRKGVRHKEPSFHHDCYPPDLEYRLGDSAHDEATRHYIEKAKSGVRGPELREYIHGHQHKNRAMLLADSNATSEGDK